MVGLYAQQALLHLEVSHIVQHQEKEAMATMGFLILDTLREAEFLHFS